MILLLASVLAFQSGSSVQTPSIYKSGWIDFNKNGREDPYENPKLPIDRRIDDLIGRMTLEEKTSQMTAPYGDMIGQTFPFPAKDAGFWKDGAGLIVEPMLGRHPLSWPPSTHAKAMNEIQKFFVEKTRLGIPTLFSAEGIKGPQARKLTCFSIPLGMGCTWNPELIHQVGLVIGKETRAMGLHNIWGPVLDVARDPRWGRFEESLGEDPWLASRYGVEMIRGIQANGTLCTSKHFGPYGFVKAGREGDARMDARATPREVEEIAYPTWRAAIEEGGLESLMVCYSDYDGVPMHENSQALEGELRKQWGLKGFTVSDADGMQRMNSFEGIWPTKDAAYEASVNAGLSMLLGIEDNPKDFAIALRKLVRDKKVSMKTIDDRVRTILYTKFRAGLFDNPYLPADATNDALEADHQVELEEARQSVVLLKNANRLLPLDPNSLHTVAVVGPTADEPAVAHKRYGPYDTTVTTLLKGIKQAVPSGVRVVYAKGCSLVDKNWPRSELYATPLTADEQKAINQAVAIAKSADVIVCGVGDTGTTSGESRTRTSLDLAGRQNDLVQAMVATGKPVVVVLMAGRPTTINWINDHVPAVLSAFCPGSSGGQALAEALFGKLDPGGKLNCTFPKSVGQLPLNFPSKRMGDDENLGDYSAGVVGPLYPFGYGLSYTSFAYSDLKIEPARPSPGQTIKVSFKLKNTGSVDGDEVAQLYSHQDWASVVPYEKRLVGFRRVSLHPGEEKLVELDVRYKDLQILDRAMHWTVEAGSFQFLVGASSQDVKLKGRIEVP